jgi:hypothetical protein
VSEPPHSIVLATFPLIAALVASAFAASLTWRYLARRRAFEGVWAIAMAQFAVASLAMFLGVLNGWTATEFRVYWVLGAVLNVPFLAQGELYLLVRGSPGAHAVMAVLLVAAGFAAWVVWEAPVAAFSLTREILPLGREVFGDGTAAHRLAQIYAIPAYLFLLAGSIWSVWRMRGRPDLRHRAGGTAAVALGATIVAIGSGVGAAFRIVPLFSVSLALGVAVMFWGFLIATRPRPADPSRPPAGSFPRSR